METFKWFVETHQSFVERLQVVVQPDIQCSFDDADLEDTAELGGVEAVARAQR